MPAKKKLFLYIAAALLSAGLALFGVHFRRQLWQISLPFILAMVIAYLVLPAVKFLETRKISRMAGILIVYAVIIATVAMLFIFIIPEAVKNTKDLLNTLPDMAVRLNAIVQNATKVLQLDRWPEDLRRTFENEIRSGLMSLQKAAMDLMKKTVSATIEVFSVFIDMVLAMIMAYYIIKDAERFCRSAEMLFPVKWRNSAVSVGREINGILSNFIRGQLVTAFIVGALEAAGLLAAGVKYPIVLGLTGGLSNIIPFFGPYIGAVPALAVALVQSPIKVLWTVIVFAVVQQIDNTFISPKIIEGRLGLHPLTTIAAVLVGGEFLGIPGMLVSVPLFAILKALGKKALDIVTE